MTEALQSLLDRIEQDGVRKADTRAAEIVAAAEARAKALVTQAEADAAARLDQADKDSQAYEARSRKALEQAARDVLLSIAGEVTRLFERLAGQGVADALQAGALESSIAAVVNAYCKDGAEGGRTELVVNPEQKDAIRSYLARAFSEQLSQGLSVEPDGDVIAGFRVRLADGNVEHDFTATAIADALSELVRPELAEIIKSTLAS